jgi:hypothetical protein
VHPNLVCKTFDMGEDGSGEHGLGREILCSLPRVLSCRLCIGSDCPYIVERTHGRLVVRKRPPVELIGQDVTTVATGSANRRDRSPSWQQAVAMCTWVVLVVLIWWTWIAHPPTTTFAVLPAVVMLLTLVVTIIGVPLVRWRWGDRGGSPKGGP